MSGNITSFHLQNVHKCIYSKYSEQNEMRIIVCKIDALMFFFFNSHEDIRISMSTNRDIMPAKVNSSGAAAKLFTVSRKCQFSCYSFAQQPREMDWQLQETNVILEFFGAKPIPVKLVLLHFPYSTSTD